MEQAIADHLLKLELGELQQFKNMAVFPLFASDNGGPKYLTLKEALEQRLLVVKELGDEGSVPELKAVNKADIPVLLLDGEELAGAKQNRVLNTTILLKKQSETIIPVSCTEEGRWSFVSEGFADSDAVAAPRLRERKLHDVACSLADDMGFHSDQAALWDSIESLSAEAEVHSPTGAMRAVFEARTSDLNQYLKAFECAPHQKGLLVIVNGEVVGFDLLSLESAYEILHPKLVKSYAIDALLQKPDDGSKASTEAAKAFIKEASSCDEKKYESVGYGWDHRFEGDKIVGSALVYGKTVIHTAFFRIIESGKVGRMAGYGRRRGFRM